MERSWPSCGCARPPLGRALAALLPLLLPATVAAQGGGTTAGLLLEIPATARALALGGAYAAVVGDEGSIFVNPAGMAPIRRFALGASFEEDFLGARLTTAAGAMRVGRFTIGFGGILYDFGGDSAIVGGQASGATITAYNALGVGAIAYRRGMISLGASTKFLRERIGEGPNAYTATGVTGDLGAAVAVFDLMAFGFVMQNLAGSLTTSGAAPTSLPRTARVGLTMNFIDPQGTMRLMTTADWVRPPGGDSHWAVGLEGGLVAAGFGVVGRMGVALGRPDADREQLSYGGGIVVRGLKLDYGFQPYGMLGGGSHRVGVRWTP